MILLKADCSLDNVTNCTSQQLSGCVSNAGLGISPALQLESDFIVSWIISLFRRCRNTSSQIHWTQSQRFKAKLMSSKDFISQPRSGKHTSIYITSINIKEKVYYWVPWEQLYYSVWTFPHSRGEKTAVCLCSLLWFVFHYTHNAKFSYLSWHYVLSRCCLAQLRSWMKVL